MERESLYGRGIDVIKIMKLDYSFIISDSLYSSGGLPHPRLYGAFPRLFAKYVREKKIMTLEEAVKKVTLMPAQRLGLESAGRLQCATGDGSPLSHLILRKQNRSLDCLKACKEEGARDQLISEMK